jgi:hypothetical protein
VSFLRLNEGKPVGSLTYIMTIYKNGGITMPLKKLIEFWENYLGSDDNDPPNPFGEIIIETINHLRELDKITAKVESK